MEKVKDALSNFCNVTAIIQPIKEFCGKGKKRDESTSFCNVTAIFEDA